MELKDFSNTFLIASIINTNPFNGIESGDSIGVLHNGGGGGNPFNGIESLTIVSWLTLTVLQRIHSMELKGTGAHAPPPACSLGNPFNGIESNEFRDWVYKGKLKCESIQWN